MSGVEQSGIPQPDQTSRTRRQFLRFGVLAAEATVGGTILGGFRKSEAQTVDEEAHRIAFENELFSKGKLDFFNNEYAGQKMRQMERAGVDRERINQFFEKEVKFDPTNKWMHDFNDQVPTSWSYWIYVYSDFKEAQEQKVTLSPNLVDAGINHPHWLVVNKVGRSQRLTADQMAKIFTSEIRPFNRDEILAAQKQMGAKDSEIQKARGIADEARRQIKTK